MMKDWDFTQKLVVFFLFASVILVHALLIAKLVADWPQIELELAAQKEQNERLEAASEELRNSQEAPRESRQAQRAAQGQRKKPDSASEHATQAFGAFSIISAGNLIGR